MPETERKFEAPPSPPPPLHATGFLLGTGETGNIRLELYLGPNERVFATCELRLDDVDNFVATVQSLALTLRLEQRKRRDLSFVASPDIEGGDGG